MYTVKYYTSLFSFFLKMQQRIFEVEITHSKQTFNIKRTDEHTVKQASGKNTVKENKNNQKMSQQVDLNFCGLERRKPSIWLYAQLAFLQKYSPIAFKQILIIKQLSLSSLVNHTCSHIAPKCCINSQLSLLLSEMW